MDLKEISLIVFGVIIFCIITGIFSYKLHNLKGYVDSGFWCGFIFGILGVIYAAGLPDIKSRKK